MIIDKKFRKLRTQMRQSAKKIIDESIKERLYFEIENKKPNKVCIFCSSEDALTKEHVLPKWVFENCEKKQFISPANGNSQTFNKTTLPTCAVCNNDLLGNIEKYITSLFSNIDQKSFFFNDYELENIIRWLETIDYKFQVLETRRRFLKHKSSEFVPYLSNAPLALFSKRTDFSPSKILANIRIAQQRITQKSKNKSLNSILIFKSKNKNFHFIYNYNEFIFIELPKFGLALFYFFSKEFISEEDAHIEAMKIIKLHYQ
ncbi:hypothetical protein [Chryseobacterium lineare]